MSKDKKIEPNKRNNYNLILNNYVNIASHMNDICEGMNKQLPKESEEFKKTYKDKMLPNINELKELELQKLRWELRINENIRNFRSIETKNKEIKKRYDDYTVSLYEIKQFNEKIKDSIAQYGDPNISFYLDHRINFEGNLVRLGNLNYYLAKTLAESPNILVQWIKEEKDIDFVDEFFIVEILKNILFMEYKPKINDSNYTPKIAKILFQPNNCKPIQNIINYLVLKLFGDELEIDDTKKDGLIKLFGSIISEKEKMVIDNIQKLEKEVRDLPDIKSDRLNKSNLHKLILRDVVEKHSREPFKVKLLNAIECHQHYAQMFLYLDREYVEIGLINNDAPIKDNPNVNSLLSFGSILYPVFGQYFEEYSPEWIGGMGDFEEQNKSEKDGVIKEAKELLKQEVVRLIDDIDYKKLTITIAGFVNNPNILKLKSDIKSGLVGGQGDDFGKKIGTGIYLTRELKSYEKKLKRASKKKEKK